MLYKPYQVLDLLISKGEAQDIINRFRDALKHYRSCQGGTVECGPMLAAHIKKQRSYRRLMKKIDQDNLTLVSNLVIHGARCGTIHGKKRGTYHVQCVALGRFTIKIEFRLWWTLTPGWPEDNLLVETHYNITGSDTWDFEAHSEYSTAKNLYREYIPKLLAGKGCTYKVNISFTDIRREVLKRA